ncbi:acyl-CoA dehydrogenase family protein [Falsiroseomonas oryziterrae]|uniref:acyl-CoA dehydrogenase family protein n=1 Tax=Falsiroseomonas oryziterrae TaxID=2911368 RepID=UPI001F34E9ED|nr:acyl-CoA dehydrogenase family protein [Roseomonas sp. NPKOSM-4]
MTELLRECRAALAGAEAMLDAARAALSREVSRDGKLDVAALEAAQLGAHGLAWAATYVEALRQAARWGERLDAAGRLGATERAILVLGFAEYGAQLAGGIPMSQVEMARPADLGVPPAAEATLRAAFAPFAEPARLAEARVAMHAALQAESFGDVGVTDPDMALLRDQFGRFTAAEVTPHAQGWHDANALIPLDLIAKLGELGTFGVTIPEAHGGLGLGKVAMCLVSEMLSEGYVGVGSLGTRSEIAGELIALNGTEAQKARWLPGIASGEILPTAVFTEPNTGSDLANLRTRAVREGDVYRVHGAKTWITHGSRSDVMTLLVRTGDAPGHRGLSMLIAPKPRGTDDDPFPAPGMSGSEIHVLGYRGMREYEIAFEGFEVPADCLLGGVEGQGFRQLMETFESARIQTAARALGVAQNALTLGLSYAKTRIQFGKPILGFPRVSNKLVMMAVETMLARQLTYFAAREKDAGRRCDVEAGMAKLLAARVAWANADAALQVHGGNGYALEYPISRVLCDARVLSIFEGAAEIQAHIIARGLLGRVN